MSRRKGSYSYFFNAGWGRTDEAIARMAWVDDSLAQMSPFSDKGTYINYLSSGSRNEVMKTYEGNYQRLLEVKKKFDPQNVFHLNRNIRP